MNLQLRRSALAALFLGLGLFALPGCRATTRGNDSHWTVSSLGPRMGYHLLGYRADRDGTYREHQYEEKKSIDLTLRRHFLNDDPYNPFEPDDPAFFAPRPPHSILPNPLYYFHLESIATGLAFLSGAGVFIPVPIGSLLGTLEEGGGHEFAEGIHQTITGDFGPARSAPPPVSEFHVRNPG